MVVHNYFLDNCNNLVKYLINNKLMNKNSVFLYSYKKKGESFVMHSTMMYLCNENNNNLTQETITIW